MKVDRNALKAQYKQREIVGGVYLIRNKVNHKILLECDTDLQGSKNHFAFAQQTGSGVNMKLQRDWTELGAEAFQFEVLEELKKGELQTPAEFRADVETLKELWADKLNADAKGYTLI